MSDRDELGLSEAFEGLTAPRSTANYASRAPAAELRGRGSRWPQALASVVAVLVALAGAGTFLALRNARQNGVATTSSGNPAARSGAAMAFDSTAGVTVMYGGVGASGGALRDTWLWNGASWSLAPHTGGPGSMFDVHMSDDPADGGLLLVGMPELPAASGGGGSNSSCVIGATGTGSASGGSTSVGPPTSGSSAPGLATAAPPSRLPLPRTAPPAGTAPAIPSTSPCPVPVIPSLQTWLFDAQGWHRVDAGVHATMPAANAQLAYDPGSGVVLAVATTFSPCGLQPGSGPARQPEIACELPASSSAGGSAGSTGAASSGSALAPTVCTRTQCPITTVPCPLAAAIYSCGGGGTVSTWVWSGGHWSSRAATLPAGVSTLVALSGANGQHATLVTESGASSAPCLGATASCHCTVCENPPNPATPVLETWRWTGSAWDRTAIGAGSNGGLTLSASSVAAVDGTMVAVADDGSTRTLDLATGKVASGGSVTPRIGEAMSEGPSGTVVLFGGIALTVATGTPSALGVTSSGVLPGSDTWRWDGHSWTHLAGAKPAVPPSPTACPAGGATLKGCFIPPGLPSILPAPAGTPGSAPGSAGSAPTATP